MSTHADLRRRIRVQEILRDAAFERLHPRVPGGHEHGGRFVSAGSALSELLDIDRIDRAVASRVVHVHADVQPEVAEMLRHQLVLAPRSASRLVGIVLEGPDTEGGKRYIAGRGRGASGSYAWGVDGIFLSPYWVHPKGGPMLRDATETGHRSGWFAPTGSATELQSTVAHEFGHHVVSGFTAHDGMEPDMARQLLPTLLETLGGSDGSATPDLLDPSETVPTERLDQWVEANRDRLAELVSEYGASSFHELLAEIWAEYSTMGDEARPHINIIGRLMHELAEGKQP